MLDLRALIKKSNVNIDLKQKKLTKNRLIRIHQCQKSEKIDTPDAISSKSYALNLKSYLGQNVPKLKQLALFW